MVDRSPAVQSNSQKVLLELLHGDLMRFLGGNAERAKVAVLIKSKAVHLKTEGIDILVLFLKYALENSVLRRKITVKAPFRIQKNPS